MLEKFGERCHSDPFAVILSAAKDLALEAKDLRDSSAATAGSE
jgi:hypothetical protein